MKSKIILFLTILACFLLQCTAMDYIAVGSVVPNLPLILCVSMGLMRGRKSGLCTGFYRASHRSVLWGILGFYALIYMYVGFLSGYAFRIYYDDDIKVPVILVAGGDLLYNLAVYALQFLLRGRMDFGIYLYRIIFPEIIYTVFLTLFVYWIFTLSTLVFEHYKERK